MRPDSHLRPVPPPADPAAAAVHELAARLRADFDAALAAEEAPSFEELEAYVDGRMGAEEAEGFAARVEDDPLLAAEVDDLQRLRRRLSGARRPARTRWVWAAAAALLLTVATGILERTSFRHAPDRRAARADAPQPAAPIFQDGFESGDAAAWRN